MFKHEKRSVEAGSVMFANTRALAHIIGSRAEQPEMRAARPRPHLEWLGDAPSMLLLIAVIVGLASQDGGYVRHGQEALFVVGGLALAALPAAALESERQSPAMRWALVLWGLGGLASLGFALERSNFTGAAIVYAVAPLVGLATARIWRRRWAAGALIALLLIGLGLYWLEGWLPWWARLIEGVQPRWLSLSWHNQSATLMAAFGLMFTGIAILSNRVIAATAGLCGAAALATVMLAGSRGGLIAAFAGLVVVVSLSARQIGTRRVLLRSAAVLGTAALVAALLIPGTSADFDPVETRTDQAAVTHARLRLLHMQAALGMFAERPLLGQGLGSYQALSRPYTSPKANLTASAHNEYAEALAAGGLALGIPLVLFGFGVTVAARRLWRHIAEPVTGEQALRTALAVGCAGAAATLGVHASIDFDWHYLVLPSLLMASLAVAGGPVRDKASGGRSPAVARLAVVPVGLLLVAGLWGLAVERTHGRALWPVVESAGSGVTAPWKWEHAVAVAENSEPATARRLLAMASAWNPGVADLRVHQRITEMRAGQGGPAQLIGVLGPRSTFAAHNAVAAALIEAGAHDQARALLVDLTGRYPMHRAWGIEASAAESWSLLVRLEGAQNGCLAARSTAREAMAQELFRPIARFAPAFARTVDEFC